MINIDRTLTFNQQAVSGSRELEFIFLRLKDTLTQLHLGDFLWDEMIVFIAEMCKNLEVVELNSTLVTDAAISHVLKRA